MDSLFTTFLLFLAAIVAILTYMLIPMASASALVMVAAIALAIGVWWHWTQFAVDYRTATWPEQLRSYSSYIIVLVVILASYGFYTFAWSDSSLQEIATRTKTAVRNAGRNATARSLSAVSEASNTLFSEGEGGAANVLASNTRNGSMGILGNLGAPVGGNVKAANANRKTSNFLLG
jgi:hypothetical protein